MERVFLATGAPGWEHPHPDRAPLEEEYSRVTAPERWQIVGARVDAWCEAAVQLGIAHLERDPEASPNVGTVQPYERVERLVPRRTGALPLVLGHRTLEGAGSGVVIAVGDPAVVVGRVPVCGCDACDSGSDDVLAEVDRAIVGAVTGALRHLRRGDVTIVADHDGWSASGLGLRDDVPAVLADPTGWVEVSGPSWLDGA